MKKKIKPWSIALIALGALLLIALIGAIIDYATRDPLQKKLNQLEKYVTQDMDRRDIKKNTTDYIVFLSTSNGKYRANVSIGRGHTLHEAFSAAKDDAIALTKASSLDVKYVKFDMAYDIVSMPMDEATEYLATSTQGYCFYGVTFDPDYKTALLESECNATSIYDYETGSFDLSLINQYLEASNRPVLTSLPRLVEFFDTYSWFLDDDGEIYYLNDSWDAYGRRTFDKIDDKLATDLVTTGTDYLRGTMDEETGRFNYTNWPQYDGNSDFYNIVHHAGVIWNMSEYYELTHDETIQPLIVKAIDYMLDQFKYKDTETAYLYDTDADEMSLGANAVGVISLIAYMRAFENQDYVIETTHLGNGILTFVDGTMHPFKHLIDSDFNPLNDYVTIFYDGEATYALCLLYEITQDGRYLDAAKAAGDFCVNNHYEINGDHWTIYAMNELTKLCPDHEAYYNLGLGATRNRLQSIL